jgi:fumarate reductase subunit C
VTTVRTQARLWYWQRISALALAVCVAVHLVTLVYAMRGGLTAAEILERTRGSVLAAAFYGIFVLACAVHAPIGLARIAEEWLGMAPSLANALALAFALLLLAGGLRAVVAVVAS